IFMEKISCKCATKVIPEGDGVAKILYKEKITRKPLIKILNGNINGVNLAYFSPNHHLILEAQKIKKKFIDK
ncbi:hypothetical protein L6B39_14305, partial [Staphylococcus aureus]|uniref:hypothetical protein n=1 Tax=Staphylococcus aureus TaxID=1280 RepID=UPI002148450E